MTDLDPLLRLLSATLSRVPTGLAAVRSQLVAMEAAEAARHGERMRMAQVTADAQKAQASAVRAALKALGKPEPTEEPKPEEEQDPRVHDAVVGLQLHALEKAKESLNLPGEMWAGVVWGFQNPGKVAGALVSALVIVPGVITWLRVFSGLVPGFTPIAEGLDAGMQKVSPADTSTSTGSAP